MKTYRYQIVQSRGMYGSESHPIAVRRSNLDLASVQAIAETLTRGYRAIMARYGGSSGGYRVISGAATWEYGHDLDKIMDA